METQTAERVTIGSYTTFPVPKEPKAREEHFELLAATAIDMLAAELSKGYSEGFLKLLHYYARYPTYSARNRLLIMLQRPEAYRVAGYVKWQSLGKQVEKGSKAIWVWSPLRKKQEDAVTGEMTDRIYGYKLSAVFADADLEDAKTNPLPTIWSPLPDDVQPLVDRAIERLKDEGITVTYKPLKTGVQGTATKDRITLSTKISDSRHRLASLLHESAHSMCHFGETAKGKTDGQIEAEAEGSCWVVLHCIGIPYSFSADYIRSHGITADQLRASLTVIGGISRCLLKLVEDEPNKELVDNNYAA